MENKYLKCFFFTIAIFFWLIVFDGVRYALDPMNENHVYMIIFRIVNGVFLLVLVYFRKRPIAKVCLFLLSFKKRNFQFLWKYFILICLLFCLITFLGYFSDINHLQANASWTYQGIGLGFILALSIAFEEEIAFRGLIAVYFKRYLGENHAILLSAISFALIHINYTSFLPFITVFLAGILFAFLMFRCKSIYPALGIHAGWDFCYYIFDKYFVPDKIPFWGEPFEFFQIALMIVLIMLTFKWVKYRKKAVV